MRTARTAAALAVLVMLAVTAFADVPTKVNYQVMLTNDSDEPLADQTVTLFFTLYDAPTEGMLLWSESQDATTNSIGVASVILGSVSPLVPYHLQSPMWLEVAVNGQTLAPRRELVAAPYALHSSDSDKLGMIVASEYALREDLWTPGSINTPSNPVDWTMLKNVPDGFADGTDAEGGTGDGHSLDADDGSPVDAVYVNSEGALEFGGSASDGMAEFFASGSENPSIKLSAGPTYGGLIELYEESGAQYGGLEPDFNGTGGFLWIDNGTGGSGFYVDGNAVSGGAQVGIYGTTSSTYFNTYNMNDDAVQLPASAVSAPEILDEPGVASTSATSAINLVGGGGPEVLLSRSIAVPDAGYVLAIATAEAYADHGGVFWTSAYFGLSDSNTAFEPGGSFYHRIPGGAAAGDWYPGVTVTWLFEVGAAGSYTYYFLGQEVQDDWIVNERHMTLVYFPTAYGNVSPAVTAEGDQVEATAIPGHALTEADIAAEQTESEAFNNARIERELAEMEAKIAKIRASMGNRNEQ